MAESEQMPNGSAVAGDVEMKDETAEPTLDSVQQPDATDPNPAPQPQSLPAVTASENLTPFQPPAAATPPAASGGAARPGSMPPQPSARPEKPVAHGGPTRLYLNQNVTPHLLEGMKYLAAYEPEKPLLWLADFLRERSKEVEG